MRQVALTAVLVIMAAPTLAGCGSEPNANKIKDPWVPEGKLKHERERTQEQLQQLNHRLVYSQTDR